MNKCKFWVKNEALDARGNSLVVPMQSELEKKFNLKQVNKMYVGR